MAEELTSRQQTQKNIADALEYLGENFDIKDKAVREGKASYMDIAKGFSGDLSRKDMLDQIGLLDFTPLGTYFAFEEGQDEIMKAEPDAFKRNMAMLGAIRQPLQTLIDKPDIAKPVIEMNLAVLEGLPVTYYMTRPIKKFFSNLKSKLEMQNPSQVND
jgi:hypothetical protein|tara:strand:- start:246 stop:722 length:477 start_codon:yes stop_codon:yes gene_type:complete